MSKEEKTSKRKSQAKKIAKKYGLDKDFLFVSTFKRYEEQLEILEKLQKSIDEEGCTVDKEYVKGRKNIYVHPAVDAYNKTNTAINQTVTTLVKIVTEMGGNVDPDDKDELLDALKMT